MSDFSELRAFIAVVDRGSFSAAAEHTGVVKSAVSKKISDLEGRLGVRLLNRTTRRVHLTESGQIFYERAKQVLQDLTEAEMMVSSKDAALQGTLKVAAPLSFGLQHLAPAINDFMIENPGLKLDVGLDDRQVDVVKEGFDIAVRIGHLSDSSLMARRLAPIRLLLCASPGYIAEWGEPDKPEDLLQHHAVSYAHIGKSWQLIDKAGKTHSVQVSTRLRSNNGDMLLGAAIAGLGITVTPSFIACEALRQKQLKVVMPDYEIESVYLYAIYPQTRFLSHRVRKFIDFLTVRFTDQPYWDETTKKSNTKHK